MSENENTEQQPASTEERVDRDGPVGVPSEDVLAQEAADLAAMNETRSSVGLTTQPAPASTTSATSATSATTPESGASSSEASPA